MMMSQPSILAHAHSDADDHLVHADEPLAGLHARCGGVIGGTIAVPQLLELVRRARQLGCSLSGTVRAQDGADIVSAWVEALPRDPGQGCNIRVFSWQTVPVPADDQAQAEARRIAIDRHLAELIARLDADQQVLAVTCNAIELAALAAAMAAGTGRRWTEFLPPENVTPEQALHWRLLDGARVAVAGSGRAWRVALIPTIVPGGMPSGFDLLLISDEPAQTALREQQQPIVRRGLVGQDLAPVLKQPIARIIANAETIRTRLAGPLPDAYSDYAGEIASAGKLLLELLEDMTDLEVVEAEGFSTAPDRIDLSEVSRQAAGILGVRGREKGIVIDVPQLSERLPAIAEFRRVLQILLNLIGNAIRYSPANSRIWVRLERCGDRAQVIVADQGPGLSAEQQARVFEKFERLGRSGDGGTGLGLYISRSLAHAMGGELTVESTPGQGARFILEVPADCAAMAAE